MCHRTMNGGNPVEQELLMQRRDQRYRMPESQEAKSHLPQTSSCFTPDSSLAMCLPTKERQANCFNSFWLSLLVSEMGVARRSVQQTYCADQVR